MDTTSLVQRIACGRTDLVWEHVANGGSASAASADGTSLLQWSAYYGDVSAVRFLLGHGETLASLGDDLGLNAAAFHGHWRLCEFLLERGADANAALEDTGETPLHAALCTPHRASHDLVVRVLLAHGADPRRTTTPGVETGAFMRDCRARGETPLHRAAALGNEDTIDLLLGAGADREARDANGDTPLAWASWCVRPDAVLRRLCHGPFTIARGRVPMLEALLGRPQAPGARVAGSQLGVAIPLLHVTSAEAARQFYCAQLGFRVLTENRADEALPDPCYLAVARDGACLHLSSFTGDAVAGGIAYVVVGNVDALRDEFAARGVPIDTGPIDQTWGTREMYVKDADRNSLRFVQDRRD